MKTNRAMHFQRRTLLIVIAILMMPFGSGCRLTYILHATAGQFRMLNNSIPVEEALESDSLSLEYKNRLLLVARIKEFGEEELGLKETQNYGTVNMESHQSPIFIVSASPKDRLDMITWWFPVVGKMPYLGFFDLERARAEKEKLSKEDLDVIIGRGDAYSSLGWFKDPVTLNLIKGSTVSLVETILHEMTHTTLYVKGQGEFNEGLAVLVGKVGALLFLEKNFGSSHPLAIEARKSIEDERIFSSFLASLLEKLELLYNSPVSYDEKMIKRERYFTRSLKEFMRIKSQFQTDCFAGFGSARLNNAYLMSIGLYHRHFHLFGAVLKKNGNSIGETLAFLRDLSKEKGDIIERIRNTTFVLQGPESVGQGHWYYSGEVAPVGEYR
ncbi:MAG: aminopeptidase [Thermodesulfobacteriota bacterium]|nr:aminopeptidase [Thermodesulfobacteriota bacterium]